MRTIDEEIKNKNFKNIYLLYGSEAYLVSMYRKRLLGALEIQPDDMNFSKFSGTGMNYGEVVDTAETMPFLAERRVILIEDSGIFKKPDETLAPYLDSVSESTILIFVEKDVDKRTSSYKSASTEGTVTELNAPSKDELMRYVAGRLKKEGLGITRDACDELVERTSESMFILGNEIDKLISYCMGKKGVEIGDVREIVPEHPEGKIYNLVNAMGEKNTRRALDIYQSLIAMQEKPAGILYMIQKQFQSMYYLDSMTEHRLSKDDACQRLGFSGKFAFKYDQLRRQMKNYSPETIRAVLTDAAEYTAATHTGRLTDGAAVELLIVKYSS